MLAKLVKYDHVFGEGRPEIDLNSQSFARFIDNDFVDQLPEIRVADLPLLDDFINQLHGSLHFGFALFDCFAVVLNIIKLLLDFFDGQKRVPCRGCAPAEFLFDRSFSVQARR